MKKVCLMVGHQNIEQIEQKNLRSWRDASVLKKSTGASGERDWHWNEWMPRLRDKLIQAGIQIYIVDAIYRQETYSQEYDLWIGGHYDGGGTGERCMISSPNRDTKPAYLNEAAQREAERFCAIWKKVYPPIVGVPIRDDLITAGMKDYYAFDYVGYDTPAVIIEHFNHTSPKGEELKKNPDLVVEADYKAILEFLGMTEEEVNLEDVIKLKDIEIGRLEGLLEATKKDWRAALDKVAKVEGDLKEQENIANQFDKEAREAREDKIKAERALSDREGEVKGLLQGLVGAEELEKGVWEALRGYLASEKDYYLNNFEWWRLIVVGITKFFLRKGGEKK